MKVEKMLYVLPQLPWRLTPVGYLHQQKVLCQNPKQQAVPAPALCYLWKILALLLLFHLLMVLSAVDEGGRAV
eukprot:2507679-Ditylum_brightwellii.AAC.1